MISIQVVPGQGVDAYKLLRDKVTHEAATWYWANKAKSRLRHSQVKKGYIEVASAEGILIAQIYPKEPKDLFYLSEKFIGRLIGWFDDELVAINIQFVRTGKLR
ncbi:MAG: hypothetical protein LAN71_03935 [Acidobacteriia bacterium]|nr:hypothetical protein [Terriglobia bacterium]